MSDANIGHTRRTSAEFVAGGHEIHQLRHEPDEGIADQIFTHHVLAFFEIAATGNIAGQDEALIVNEKTCVPPK